MSLAAAGSVWAQDPAGGQETDPAAPAEVPPPAAASDAPAAPDPQLPPRSTPSADAPPPAGGDNVYQAISRRNPFGLLPPPPPPDAEPPPPPPPPPPVSVKLAGFTDLLGRKRAFLVLTEQGPNKQPKTKALHEGERESGVEIVSIDFKAKTVKVNNNGTVTNVGFAKLDQTAAPPAAMGAGGVPGVPGQPPVHRVLPNMPGNPNPGANPAVRPSNPGSPNAAVDNSSVILGGGAQPAETAFVPGRRGGVFVSGGEAVTPSGGSFSPPAGGAVNPGYTPAPTYSSTPGVAATVPPRETRTRVPRYQVPIPPPLPEPGGNQ